MFSQIYNSSLIATYKQFTFSLNIIPKTKQKKNIFSSLFSILFELKIKVYSQLSTYIYLYVLELNDYEVKTNVETHPDYLVFIYIISNYCSFNRLTSFQYGIPP